MPSNPLPSPGSPAGVAQGCTDLPALAAAVRDGHAPTLAQARVLLARVAELERTLDRLRTVIGSTLSSDRRRVELAEQVLAAFAPIPDAGGGKA